MTTACEKPDHRSLPRKKHAPSERDQAIFLAYRAQGLTQEKLADDNHLSQRRVSQIIQRVQRWLADCVGMPVGATAGLPSSASAVLSHDQLQRLERHLERARSQAVYDRALRAHDVGIQTLKTTRQGKRGTTAFEETVTREVLPSPQHLRTAIQASRELDRIADKPAPPAPPKPADHQDVLWQQTLTSLYRARQQAEDEHKVTAGHGHLDYLGTVKHWLDALLGNRPEYFHPEDISPGTPLHELATFYSRSAAEDGEAAWEGEAPAEPAFDSDPTNLQPETCNVERETSSLQPETWNLKPETSSPSNSSTASNLPPAEPLPADSQLEPSSGLTPPASPSLPLSKSPPLNPDDYFTPSQRRSFARERKLEAYRAAVKSGLPFMMHWDPEDGPPPPICHHVDDYGYIPSPPPSKEEAAQRAKDYLAKLRAECRANA